MIWIITDLQSLYIFSTHVELHSNILATLYIQSLKHPRFPLIFIGFNAI